MNLDLVKMLASSARGMLDSSVLGPLEGYQAASAGAFGMALMILGDQFDGAVEKLTEENAAIRVIAAQASSRVDGELGERLSTAATEQDASLRVSVLQASNDALRSLLIELHAWVEDAGDSAADLDEVIWSELLRSTQRRHVALGPF